MIDRMTVLNTHAFLVVEKAWKILGYDMLDWKIEFGWSSGVIYIGDVIDADSWRVMKDGQKLSKQAYRDNEGLTVMEKVLRRTAVLTSSFRIPEQTLVIWSGSPNDKVTAFEEALTKLLPDGCPGLKTAGVVNSGHKKPIQSMLMLQDMEFGCKGLGISTPLPDPVIVTNVGMSNGLGPTCSANSMIPVISTVPDPVDTNSSLRMPSEVPLMVVADPKLAVLAALKILAGRNPALYALLRLKQEEHAINAILLP
jgi:phosphoribosylcarboxyaminoimidazole (NCAIR) mutase